MKNTKFYCKKQPSAMYIMLWVLAFWVFAVFALSPLARLSTRYNLSAETTIKSNTFYTSAPAYIAGDIYRGITGSLNGSSIKESNGELLNTGTMPSLFTTGGNVDLSVLLDLLEMINSCTKTSSTDSTNGISYYSAKSFGLYGDQDEWEATQKGNAQILVKLFETVANTDDNTDINSFTSQYWQAVYRSTNSSADVLTLYMVKPYTSTCIFDNNYGDYSNSAIHTKITKTDYGVLNTNDYFGSQFTDYIVAPYQLTSDANASDMSETTDANGTYLKLGGWQSSAYQTSYNSSRALYSTNSGVGSSGYGANNSYYNLENGMDGLSGPHGDWGNAVTSVYTDKLWLPSAYEALHTGYASNSNSVKAETVNESATGRKIENGKYYDEANSVVYLSWSSYNTKDGTTSNSNNNANRTGLWELSGYDRASLSGAWLRCGNSDYYSYARGIN